MPARSIWLIQLLQILQEELAKYKQQAEKTRTQKLQTGARCSKVNGLLWGGGRGVEGGGNAHTGRAKGASAYDIRAAQRARCAMPGRVGDTMSLLEELSLLRQSEL